MRFISSLREAWSRAAPGAGRDPGNAASRRQRRGLARAVAFLALLVCVAACDKASLEECDKGCRNYFELHYWQEADMAIARAPAEEREALRQQKIAELEPRMNQNLELCVQKCKSGAESKRATCWAAARTTAEAKKCAND